MKKWLFGVAAMIGIAATASSALATPLPPGSPPLPVTTLPIPAGSTALAPTLSDTISSTAGNDLLLHATVYRTVIRDRLTGNLDFAFQVFNFADSLDSVIRVT